MTASDDAGFALAVHGGAGTLRRGAMTQEREALYRAGLARALRAGHQVLGDGGSALDAVTAAVVALEDDPLFNAGRGAVFTRAGTQEMDAAGPARSPASSVRKTRSARRARSSSGRRMCC
jgi:beta-aspartyl-peptidase (threonine type)